MLLLLIPTVQCIGVEAAVAELRQKSRGQGAALPTDFFIIFCFFMYIKLKVRGF